MLKNPIYELKLMVIFYVLLNKRAGVFYQVTTKVFY